MRGKLAVIMGISVILMLERLLTVMLDLMLLHVRYWQSLSSSTQISIPYVVFLVGFSIFSFVNVIVIVLEGVKEGLDWDWWSRKVS